MSFILGLLGLFAIIGIILPTKWHKRVAYKKVSLAQRRWNFGLLIACILIAMILGPSKSEVEASENKVQLVQQELDKTKKQLEESNNKIAQLTEENQKLSSQLQPYLDAEKKKQEELAKAEAEKKAAEEKRKQEEAEKKAQATNTSKSSSSGSSNKTSSSKPTYRGTGVTCSDFSSSAEATAYMKAYKVYKLDRDRDGIACESLN